ncbi:hypothetical protein FS819_023290 [Allorhizobium sp. Av2]|nr:hypothetical protein [Allorhizobium sp. Av2]
MIVTEEMVNRADSILSRSRPGIPDEVIRHAIAAAIAEAPTQEDRTHAMLETIVAPDNGTSQEVLSAVLQCAKAWVPEARIVGNVRAGDIARAIEAALSAQPQPIESEIQRYAGIYRDGEGWDIEPTQDGEYVRYDDHVADRNVLLDHLDKIDKAKSAQPQTVAPNFPELLSEDEKKSMLREAEILWKDLEENKLGGFSCQNRPFYIVHAFKCAIEKYGHRDVGLNWSKDALDAARSAITTAPAQEPTVDDSSRSEGEYSNVYDAVQEPTLVFRNIQAREQEIKPNMYDSPIHFLRIDPPDQQARIDEQERLRFEGDLDKWMKIISAGITGYQPEAYAVMDMACQELVRSRTRIAELETEINIKADFIEATVDQMAGKDERIAELEASLKPFAEEADHISSCLPNPRRVESLVMRTGITYGDFRNARAALNKGKAE